MKLTRLNGFALLTILAMFVVAYFYYPALPDPVPTHWNGAGEIDGWTAKPWGVWVFPLIALLMTTIMFILPVVSPKGFRLDSARKAFDIVILILALFMLVVEVLSFRAAINGSENLMMSIPVLVGVLFIGLGNYLGKFPKNFFVGIRTPWTLASDEVWDKTHRLAGYLFIFAGLGVVSTAFFRSPEWVIIVLIAVAALIPAVYSFVLYRKLHGFKEDNSDTSE